MACENIKNSLNNSAHSGGGLLSRRNFLSGTVGFLLSGGAFGRERNFPFTTIRLASNQGVENATIQQLMADRGYARALRLGLQLVASKEISGPIDALVNDKADVCMVSAFAGVLPEIEQGAPVRLIGTAMQLPDVAVYSARPDIRRIEDLVGRTIGIGSKKGLLHIMMIALLKKKGIDSDRVQFVQIGSNTEVLKAVADGKIDAGPSGIAGLSETDKVHVLLGGRLWQDLGEFTYQPAYASLRALKEQPEAVARCLASYLRLFRFLSRRGSREAYIAARQKAGGDPSEGAEVWDFIQRYHPYAHVPGITPRQVAFLQELNVAVGLQQRILPYDQVVDLKPAVRAYQLLT